MRIRLAISAAMIVTALLCACDNRSDSSSSDSLPQEPKRDLVAEAKTLDKQIAERISNKDSVHAEASKWLDGANHTVFKGDKNSMRKLIANIYAAGAPNVEAIDIATFNGGELCASFIITLPSDAATRVKVFQEANVFFTLNGEEPDDAVKDIGQAYLELQTD